MFKLINKKDIKNYLKENNIDKISKRIIINPIYPLNYKQSKRKGNINQTIPFILEVLDKCYIVFNKNFIINEIEEIELKENNNQLILYEEKNNDNINENQSLIPKTNEITKYESINIINQNVYNDFKIVDKIKSDETNIEFIHPYTIKFLGNRGSGKTTYLINYLNFINENNINRFNDIYFISNSNSQSLLSLLKVDVNFINLSDLSNIILNNNNEIKEFEKPTLMIFDDCMRNLRNNKNILDIYSRGRHCNMSIISLEQHTNYSNNVERNNTDYFLLFKINDHENIISFNKKYCNLKDDVFINMINRCHKDDLPLIISMNSRDFKYRYNFNNKIDENLIIKSIIKNKIKKTKQVKEYEYIKRSKIKSLTLKIFCCCFFNINTKYKYKTHITEKEYFIED